MRHGDTQYMDTPAVLVATFTGITTLIALILSFLAFKRDADVRKEQIRDRPEAQARLITAWWSRVSSDTGEDLSLQYVPGPDWPEESGHRVWISNSSDDAVYECRIEAVATPASAVVARLEKGELVTWLNMLVTRNQIMFNQGTLPPRTRSPFLLPNSLVESVGSLTVYFRDAAGRKWQRTGGELKEDHE
jgi:hypothetical protein